MKFFYPNPDDFKRFRSARLRKSEGVKRHQEICREKIGDDQAYEHRAEPYPTCLDAECSPATGFELQVPVLKPSRQDQISEEAL
jgi:hypothetical protein